MATVQIINVIVGLKVGEVPLAILKDVPDGALTARVMAPVLPLQASATVGPVGLEEAAKYLTAQVVETVTDMVFVTEFLMILLFVSLVTPATWERDVISAVLMAPWLSHQVTIYVAVTAVTLEWTVGRNATVTADANRANVFVIVDGEGLSVKQ